MWHDNFFCSLLFCLELSYHYFKRSWSTITLLFSMMVLAFRGNFCKTSLNLLLHSLQALWSIPKLSGIASRSILLQIYSLPSYFPASNSLKKQNLSTSRTLLVASLVNIRHGLTTLIKRRTQKLVASNALCDGHRDKYIQPGDSPNGIWNNYWYLQYRFQIIRIPSIFIIIIALGQLADGWNHPSFQLLSNVLQMVWYAKLTN